MYGDIRGPKNLLNKLLYIQLKVSNIIVLAIYDKILSFKCFFETCFNSFKFFFSVIIVSIDLFYLLFGILECWVEFLNLFSTIL